MSGEQGERILTPIVDLVKASPNEDRTEQFQRLWGILDKMHARIMDRFELQLDPCCAELVNYELPTGHKGTTEAYVGPEIDWYVHSWCGHPSQTFSNMHITITLGPQYLVPNFGFAFGTVPDLFMYMDYLPRVDLLNNIDYADRYYTEVNEEFLRLQSDPAFKPFISRDLYTRIAMTPTAVGYGAEPNEDNIAVAEEAAMSRLERWLQWVDEAEKTPVELRAELAARDHRTRRNICERDPANQVASELYGEEFADQLVKTISAANRSLPRPTGDY
ncbi:MAG: hypothetical protein ABJ308_03495 [Halieaceae bacterium]